MSNIHFKRVDALKRRKCSLKDVLQKQIKEKFATLTSFGKEIIKATLFGEPLKMKVLFTKFDSIRI